MPSETQIARPYEIRRLVLDGLSSAASRRAYAMALDRFLPWWTASGMPFAKAALQAWRTHLEQAGLAPATINLHLAAVRKLALEASDNGLLAPETAAAIARVRGIPRLGIRLGRWLTATELERLLELPSDATLRGIRDRAILALLAGCGLRRAELVSLSRQHLVQRDGRWLLLNLEGKHRRIRSMPMPAWAWLRLNRWLEAATIEEGGLFRAVRRGDQLTTRPLTAQAVFNLVREYSGQMGQSITPHDLRRTFAHLAHSGGAPLEQIQIVLGHASVQTTERYLGIRQEFQDPPCDHLGVTVDS